MNIINKKTAIFAPQLKMYIMIIRRNVETRSFRAHSTAWLSGSACTGKQGILRLHDKSEKTCGIQ